ncbi:MAG: hypothetical protein GQ569_12855 [Methylococcaceae bacterium]|nr:hypothetical protein [Methylococcaceae bacterium]
MKNIVIIGNAPIDTDYSKTVNSADFVIRFNEARNYHENNGTKTDALCINNLSDPARRFAKYKTIKKLPFIEEVKEIWFPRSIGFFPKQFLIKPFRDNTFKRTNYKKHIISRNNLENKKIICFSSDLYIETCNELNIDPKSNNCVPSSGYLAIQYVLQRFQGLNANITLLGFTFMGADCHPWENEKNKVIELQKQKVINLI